jgi:hypothetical protein
MLTIFKNRFVLIPAILFALILSGCSTSSNSVSSSSGANANAETKTSSQDSSAAQKKISMAIGQEISEFTISSQVKVDAPAGYDGTQYTVKTSTGKTYKCEILEMSGFGKAMTWGMGTGAGAMCTDFTKGSADAGKTNKASCNALLKAAGRC